jgi:excinuclease ABC subunit C
MFDLNENLKLLPDKPGVYIYKDQFGQVIYVGKAISLKKRVRQYFQSIDKKDLKSQALVSNIFEFEYIVTNSEVEALILEGNLVKKYMPKYNVLLRDDKTFPYIKLTMREEFPRILKTRKVLKDGSKYFGPYTDASAVNQIIDMLNYIYPLKKCSSMNFPKDSKPCLNYHIGQCLGICQGNVNKSEYMGYVSEIQEFLQGKSKKILDYLEVKMKGESDKFNFEAAAVYRDYIIAVTSISGKQNVVLEKPEDIDVIVTARIGENNDPEAYGIVLFIRKGKLMGKDYFKLQTLGEEENASLIEAFIKQYYGDMNIIPREIIVEEEIPEKLLIEEWLKKIKGGSVKIFSPARGEKKALLLMAKKNMDELGNTIYEKRKNQIEVNTAISSQLTEFVYGNSYEGKLINRVEAYDISNISGVDSVGVMVVFQDGKPVRKDYRRFMIRTIEGPNDYGSLSEVVYRRFNRALKGDQSFTNLPDLLLIDGGENQVSVVRQVLSAMNLNIPVCGMVKDDKHRTRGLVFNEELVLKNRPVLYKYIGTIQEEVHRFAIDYHHNLHRRKIEKSWLDTIDGIGEKRRNSLLTHFGSIDKIKAATVEDLISVKGMNRKVAEKIINLKTKE